MGWKRSNKRCEKSGENGGESTSAYIKWCKGLTEWLCADMSRWRRWRRRRRSLHLTPVFRNIKFKTIKSLNKFRDFALRKKNFSTLLSFQFFPFLFFGKTTGRSERTREKDRKMWKKVQAHSFMSTIEMGANFKTLLENGFNFEL